MRLLLWKEAVTECFTAVVIDRTVIQYRIGTKTALCLYCEPEALVGILDPAK